MQSTERKSALTTAFSPATILLGIVILDLSYRGKRYLDYLAVRAFHLDAWGCECLGGLHAANDATHAFASNCNNLNIIFTVKRLQRREGFSYFHVTSSLIAIISGHELFKLSKDIALKQAGCLCELSIN
jgi:hypothetical protein